MPQDNVHGICKFALVELFLSCLLNYLKIYYKLYIVYCNYKYIYRYLKLLVTLHVPIPMSVNTAHMSMINEGGNEERSDCCARKELGASADTTKSSWPMYAQNLLHTQGLINS